MRKMSDIVSSAKKVDRPPITIGVVGTRSRDTERDRWMFLREFKKVYQPGDKLVSGGCAKGGDRFAEELANEQNIELIVHYPNRSNLDPKLLSRSIKAAYTEINYARNTLIAQDCDILIAIISKDRKGGTEDTIKKTLALGKQVIYVDLPTQN